MYTDGSRSGRPRPLRSLQWSPLRQNRRARCFSFGVSLLPCLSSQLTLITFTGTKTIQWSWRCGIMSLSNLIAKRTSLLRYSLQSSTSVFTFLISSEESNFSLSLFQMLLLLGQWFANCFVPSEEDLLTLLLRQCPYRFRIRAIGQCSTTKNFQLCNRHLRPAFQENRRGEACETIQWQVLIWRWRRNWYGLSCLCWSSSRTWTPMCNVILLTGV